MDKKLLQTSCLLIFVALCYSAETVEKLYDEQKFYDLTGLVAKTARGYRNSMLLKTLKPLDNIQLQGVDEDFEFSPSGIQFLNFSKCFLDIMYTVENIRSEWGLKSKYIFYFFYFNL